MALRPPTLEEIPLAPRMSYRYMTAMQPDGPYLWLHPDTIRIIQHTAEESIIYELHKSLQKRTYA